MSKPSVGVKLAKELVERIDAIATARSAAENRTVTRSEVLRSVVHAGLPSQEAALAAQEVTAGAAPAATRAPRAAKARSRSRGRAKGTRASKRTATRK